MMCNVLVQAGCRGKSGYEIPFDQEFDHELPPPEQDIVWVRSFPHGGIWPHIDDLIKKVREAGYDERVLVMTRASWVVRQAQQKHHAPFKNLWRLDQRIGDAYYHIFDQLLRIHGAEFYMVSYDELVHEPRALPLLLEMLELPVIDFEFRNANAKWYGETDGN